MRNIRNILNITTKVEKNRATICGAIRSRRVIEFYYHGGYRTLEPFCLGVVLDTDADNESLICYQTAGFSELREVVGWKLYRASEMEDIEVFNEQFSGNRPGYDPDNIDMAVIRCCVVPVPEEKKIEPKVKPVVTFSEIERPESWYLTHNELMRRFRFTHPLPIPELYTYIFSGPWFRTPPERTEWKNRHFLRSFGESYLALQTA
ncbi:MAG: hypothetical protein JXA51_01260 [Dehalococcoidales bacterium]|nr:hypothetical protein [Dehalococcoidales bacterium]